MICVLENSEGKHKIESSNYWVKGSYKFCSTDEILKECGKWLKISYYTDDWVFIEHVFLGVK